MGRGRYRTLGGYRVSAPLCVERPHQQDSDDDERNPRTEYSTRTLVNHAVLLQSYSSARWADTTNPAVRGTRPTVPYLREVKASLLQGPQHPHLT